jgi:hypothetical protein
MDTEPVKLTDEPIQSDKIAHPATEQDETRDAKFGLLKITRPLDINPDEQGGDPYNSTGRFSRIKD